MDKVKRPRGLIRYASLNNIENKKGFRFTPRMILYTIILILLLSLLTFLMANRTDYSINILRTPGMLYQEQPDGTVSNVYDFNIVNKTFENTPIELKLENVDGTLKLVGKDIILEPQEIMEAKFLIMLPKDELTQMNTPIEIGIYSEGELIKKVSTSFLGPVELNEKESE